MPDTLMIRQAIIDAIPYTTSNYGESPDRQLVYVPPAHVKALRLESNLVIGSRGVGKSFWTAALDSPKLRAIIDASVRDLDNVQVHVGFAVIENINAYPNAEVFDDLIGKGFAPYDVWRAVVIRWLADLLQERLPMSSWLDTTDWVRQNPEPVAQLLHRANRTFQEKRQRGLIVFDALDRSSNAWQTMDRIVRDLLKVALWLKAFPAIHAKVFLRDDQFERTVADFPDASKLLATRAELTWQPHDLHGLLWQLLCNAQSDHAEVLRDAYRKVVGYNPILRDGVFLLAEDARREGFKQRSLFEELTGPWMGKDRRRGVPYVWSVSHLADGKGRTSPRSFLAAIRAAAEDSAEKYPDHSYAVHYESIKRGVQKASEIRIAEMAEDYPWVTNLFEPLRGLVVPCEYASIEDRWKQKFPQGLSAIEGNRLPPQHAERGWSGIHDDLQRLGLVETMKDGRINMPDLYRVGFGLGRRGGVKPVR